MKDQLSVDPRASPAKRMTIGGVHEAGSAKEWKIDSNQRSNNYIQEQRSMTVSSPLTKKLHRQVSIEQSPMGFNLHMITSTDE